MYVIEANDITKIYPLRRGTRALLGRGGIRDWLSREPQPVQPVLDGITFRVAPGESLGIIGRNGSGKSTLLKILGGVTLPTSGSVIVRGRVASLLELGAGFHPMLTGRENVYLNAGLLGVRHRDVDKVFDSIVAFSGISEYIDQPVDTYSSGMYVRIAFSVAVHVNPDIFLVDEVLAVGDEEFQRKSRTKIGELREQGKTIVFVSHDLGLVHALCDRVVLLSKGKMFDRGSGRATIDFYLRQVGQESGIHTLHCGDNEAVFSHGRISLFHHQKEITAPSGLEVFLQYMGQYFASHQAQWVVQEATATECCAEGTFARLPAKLIWKISLDAFRLRWSVQLVPLKPLALQSSTLRVSVPTSYQFWHYAGQQGRFPEIAPGHLEYARIVDREAGCWECGLRGDGDSPPPLYIQDCYQDRATELQLLNSDYLTGARCVDFTRQFPRDAEPLTKTYDLGSIEIGIAATPERWNAWLESEQARYVVRAQNLRARCVAGRLEVFHGERRLTEAFHWHTQWLISNWWTLSQYFQWTEVRREGDVYTARGISPRFPLAQKWEVWPEDDALMLRVTLEALEPMVIQEWNVSVGLIPTFTQWQTDHEQGEFPDFAPGHETWQHLNRDFRPGSFIRAWGTGLPMLQVDVVHSQTPLRMTPINTGYSQHTRVLQLLASPERTVGFTFSPGEHILCAVRMRTGNPAS